ncbi:hypothetical protein [Lactococcus garvieae]|uniref:hypothetical protein n=1 Tax=Lactococcus garvieae TaxID=1363 RepID=UPI0022E781AA|nr:hypothetical protein [Lactococcus garvieae]
MTKFELPEKPKKTNTSEDFNNLRKAVDELDKFDYAWKTHANKADRRINAANKYIEELERENQRLIAENVAVKTLVDNAKPQQALPVVPECVGDAIAWDEQLDPAQKEHNFPKYDLDADFWRNRWVESSAEALQQQLKLIKLEKQIATAVEALKNAYGEINSLNGSDSILEELEQTLAEIGGEDE